MANGRHEMALAHPGFARGNDVDRFSEEGAAAQAFDLQLNRRREARKLQPVEGLAQR